MDRREMCYLRTVLSSAILSPRGRVCHASLTERCKISCSRPQAARLTALMTALSEAVTMLASMPTPQ
jgi:hypothetical protein